MCAAQDGGFIFDKLGNKLLGELMWDQIRIVSENSHYVWIQMNSWLECGWMAIC